MGKDRPTAREAIWEALQRLVQERLARRAGGHLVEAQIESLDLPLTLPLERSAAASRRFGDQLVGLIDGQLDDAVHQAAAFRPGHTYCHRCTDAACEHSTPPSCRHVFAGYGPTGTPRWEDLGQLLLERRHPRVDELFDDPPALLTMIQPGAELTGSLLDVFEDGSYKLLGQVVAGFFPVRSRAEDGRGVVAITLQVAASRARHGRTRLGLNLLGRTPGGEGLERLWDGHQELPWRRATRWAQGALQTVGRRGHGRRHSGDDGVEQRVQGILSGLVRRLEHGQRARSRRTRHAERRHDAGTRPTSKAFEDARCARSETLLVDERQGTLVVLGDRGRTHFFSATGRHVSSVRYNRDAIERRVRLEQWRPASDDQLRSFLRLVEAAQA